MCLHCLPACRCIYTVFRLADVFTLSSGLPMCLYCFPACRCVYIVFRLADVFILSSGLLMCFHCFRLAYDNSFKGEPNFLQDNWHQSCLPPSHLSNDFLVFCFIFPFFCSVLLSILSPPFVYHSGNVLLTLTLLTLLSLQFAGSSGMALPGDDRREFAYIFPFLWSSCWWRSPWCNLMLSFRNPDAFIAGNLHA